MADKKKEELSVESNGFNFEKNPEEYCKSIYLEAMERFEQLKPINVENYDFYEGKDIILTNRAQNKKVVRSSIFAHELTPAVDARIGGAISRLEDEPLPLSLLPKNKDAEKDEKDAIADMCIDINQQLRDAGYLSETFKEHIHAAEIQRSPSAVKVFWESKTVLKPFVKNRTMAEQIKSILALKDPRPKVIYKRVDVSMPFVEWLNPDEFLYEPNVSIFNKSNYCIHAMWLDFNDIMARAEDFNYDEDKIKLFKEELGQEDDIRSEDKTTLDEVEKDKGTPFEKGFKDGKFLLTESYVVTYDENANERVWLVVMIGNKYMVSKKPSPYKTIKFPFVPLVANSLPGRLEGLSSIDLGKQLQKLYNEVINSYLDGISYRIFPPFKVTNSLSMKQMPIYGPGEVWRMNNIDDLKPVIENPGMLPDLLPLLTGISAKIREILTASDLSQGFQSTQYEKATSIRQRVSGEARRIMPTYKRYGMAIVAVAEMFIALNQQYSDDGHKFVYDVITDVPSLTLVTDPDSEKQDSLLLLSQMLQNPLYQTPTGQRKIRNMMERAMRQFIKTEIDDYVPTEEEHNNDITAQAEMQDAMLEKETTKQTMAVTQSLQQNQGA